MEGIVKDLKNGIRAYEHGDINIELDRHKEFKNDIKLARQGDADAFARLYSDVYKQMYHTALYNLRNSHDACDAVSEAVIDAFGSIKKLKNEDAFKSWIMKILFTKIKKKQKEYMNFEVEITEDIKMSSFNYEKAELKEALDSLDDESRAILSLAVLGGYSSKDISKIFGINASTARSKLSRIKEQLRLFLGNERSV